jgi:predicted amidohydrolase
LTEDGSRTREVLERGNVRFVLWSEFSDGYSGNLTEYQTLARVHNASIGAVSGQTLIFFDPDKSSPLFRYTMHHSGSWGANEELAAARSSVLGDLNAGICFDFDNPEFVRAGTSTGLLLQPAMVWEVPALYAHSSAMYRAIENGAYVVRCTQRGASGVWDPFGNRLMFQLRADADVLYFQIPAYPPKVWTVYASFGFIFDYLLQASVLAILGLLAVTFRRSSL